MTAHRRNLGSAAFLAGLVCCMAAVPARSATLLPDVPPATPTLTDVDAMPALPKPAAFSGSPKTDCAKPDFVGGDNDLGLGAALPGAGNDTPLSALCKPTPAPPATPVVWLPISPDARGVLEAAQQLQVARQADPNPPPAPALLYAGWTVCGLLTVVGLFRVLSLR
jgi:hypothetical protein